MPDPEKIIYTVNKAIAATQSTPGRQGRFVELTDVDDVLVAGDLHGHVGHFQEVLKHADLAKNPKRQLIVQELIHGPFMYPKGGEKSHQLLDLFSALKMQYPTRVHFLPGNHEFAQVTNRPIARCAGEMNSLFYQGVATAYGSRSISVASAYKALILVSPLGIRTANSVFLSHSLPTMAAQANWSFSSLMLDELPDECYQPGGAVFDLVWGRDLALATAKSFLSKVNASFLITGHVPCDEGFRVPNEVQLVLDSQEPPAACCLFPANRPTTHAEIVSGVSIL
jgi:hypothetical protein